MRCEYCWVKRGMFIPFPTNSCPKCLKEGKCYGTEEKTPSEQSVIIEEKDVVSGIGKCGEMPTRHTRQRRII